MQTISGMHNRSKSFGVIFSLILLGCSGSGSSSTTSSSNTTTTSSSTNSNQSQVASVYSFNLPDTGQTVCYNSVGTLISCAGSGQDGAYIKNAPSFTNNANKIITDNITTLMWTQTADTNNDGTINSSDKKTQAAAQSYCEDLALGGYTDWRLPDIKTMYSLINFNGIDPSSGENGEVPFIDTSYFNFAYGDVSAGERHIDAQWATTTNYVSTTMNGNATMFGVNLADGRIKGYPVNNKTYYVYCVRGNASYGQNNFTLNNNATVTDSATGLMWGQSDSGVAMNWQSAIDYCENDTTAGYADWRLPNAKELQSIVDYTRSPATTNSAAINPVFNATSFTNEAGQSDFGFYWTSTTHIDTQNGAQAAYVSFGRALGYMNGQWLDVHGAGAQRSDPKSYPTNTSKYTIAPTYNGGSALTFGPQGDVVRVNNYVRCVRN